MLQYIHLKNLQIHKDTILELSPGVNVIIGKSRSGKTAILRAIRKVLENRPVQGIERWIHKHDPKDIIEIEIGTTDDHVVSWSGPKDQKYVVNGEELKGFGQSVPPQVAEVLNIGDINMADQHDRPFLLFDSPGEVARTLNRVVHLDDIDTALANISSLKRQNDQEARVQEARLLELREREAEFPDLEGVEEYVAMLEGWERDLVEKSAKAKALKSIQEMLTGLRARLRAVRLPEGVGNRVDSLLAKQGKLDQKKYTMELLRGRQRELASLRARLAMLKPALAQDGWVGELLTKNAQLQAKRGHIRRLKALGQQISGLRLGLESNQTIIRSGEIELRELLPPECIECPLFS